MNNAFTNAHTKVMKKGLFLLTALFALCLTPCLSACGNDEPKNRNLEKTMIENTDQAPESCPDGNCPDDDCPDNTCPDGDCPDRQPHGKHGMPKVHGFRFKIPTGGEVRIFEVEFEEVGFPFPHRTKPAPEPEIPTPEKPEEPSTEKED